MLMQQEKVFKFDITTGSTMIPVNVVRDLEYNIMNMRVGKQKIGTAKWFKALFKALKKLGYEELNDIEWKYGKPDFLRDHENMLKEIWTRTGKSYPKRKRRGAAPKFPKRVRKMIELLRQCPIERVSFVTVVAGFAFSKEDALQMAHDEGIRLDRFIRSRFKHAAFVMFPEVDVVEAKKIPVYLMPQKGWKDGIDDEMQIYKVHFHGVMHVPDMGHRSVELAFRRTKTNRKTKRYSGINQVRSLPMNSEPGQDTSVPDVLGVSGYATKKHFKPPVLLRMLEGFADWLWLTHKIHQDPSLIITGGSTDGIWDYCQDCKTYHRPEEVCECRPVVVYRDFYGFDDPEPERVVPKAPTESQTDEQPKITNTTLNSGFQDTLFTWVKRIEKNVFGIMNLAWKTVRSRSQTVLRKRPP